MNMKLKIAFCTPCFGGMLYDGYLTSAIMTTQFLMKNNVEFLFRTIGNESLINRARNDMATFVLEDPSISHMFFIDADIGWTPNDVARLINAQMPVVGGTYPLKCLPLQANLNLLDEDIAKYGHAKDLDQIERLRKEAVNEKGLMKVRHIPTGFLFIRRDVLECLRPHVESYVKKTPDGLQTFYNFFSISVHEGVLLSEDWHFSRICRENGIDVWFDPHVIVEHHGTTKFQWPKTIEKSST